MSSIPTDEIIHNIKKISEKYQEILLYLMQGKGNIIPPSLIDQPKTISTLTNLSEQFLENPEKFLSLQVDYIKKFQTLVTNSLSKFIGQQTNPLYKPSNKDRRFKDAAWQENAYFDFIKQFYLMSSDWMRESISQYELTPELKGYLDFATSQFINALSPSNFIFYNPQVLKESFETGGQNIVQGLSNLLEDIKKSGDILNIATTDKSAFKLGGNVAATPGKVVFQNQLIQLICYEPKNKTYAIPIFIIPPWINKYYILDLSSHNSMVKWLVDNNFQVFIVSWINPDESLSHKNFEDYLKEGVLEPCEYIKELGYQKMNAVGYCIGGTLLAMALSFMKVNDINIINNATFLTTLLDFNNPGDLGIFINESSILAIETEMSSKGYFDGRYLSNNFSLLRANDLVWSFFINNYLLGRTPLAYDLLYWNADPTNLPAQMHSYYLRNMYLNNLLRIPNSLKLMKTPIDLTKIDCPAFFIAAKDDHIAPWSSVYDGMKLLDGNKTFCLTESGHVAGIINPPGASKYSYKINDDLSLSSNEWLAQSQECQGSWWSYWKDWLVTKSGKLEKSIEYSNLNFIEPAPGSYVKTSI